MTYHPNDSDFDIMLSDGTTWISNTVPVAAVIFVLAAIISGAMVFTTKYETPPSYYKTYSSYVGFVVSVVWVYMICNEVVSVIRVSTLCHT